MYLWISDNINEVKEGGSARLKALSNFVLQNEGTSIPLSSYFKGNIFLAWLKIFRSKAKIVLCSHPDHFICRLIFPPNYKNRKLRVIIGYAIGFMNLIAIKLSCLFSGKHFIVDAADLISLEQEMPTRNRITFILLINLYEGCLMRWANYILAVSKSEADVIKTKWKVNPKKLIPAPNGAYRYSTDNLKEPVAGDEITFLYAGTLSSNQNRTIEFINAFESCAGKKCKLLICGTEGEWLDEYTSPKVKYLGALHEEDLYQLACQCDVGVILYFSDVPYFNLSHPVKLSFYISANLPVIVGDATEIANFVRENQIGVVMSGKNDIESSISEITNLKKLQKLHYNVDNIREQYYWDNIFERAFQKIHQLSMEKCFK